MKAFKEIFLSQLRMFARERVTLLITLIMPLILGTFFGLVFSRAESGEVRLLVVDEDRTEIARLMINGIKEGAKNTRLKIENSTREEALTQLEEGGADGILVFPRETSLSVMGVKESKVQIYFNPTRMESAAIARLIMVNAILEINLRVARAKRIFTIEENSIGEKKVPLANFYFPNFLAISLLWLSLFATALPLVKQRERGAFVQMKVTPLSPFTFMLASTLSQLFIGVMQSGLFLAAGFVTLKLSVLDNLFLFILAVILGNLSFIFLGYMTAVISKSMQSAEAIAQLFNFGMMFLSGVFFTREMLPDIFNKISYIMPLTYLADLFRQLMTGYEGSFPLWLDFSALIVCAVLFACIALRFFKLFSR